jgi:hypothetical protein
MHNQRSDILPGPEDDYLSVYCHVTPSTCGDIPSTDILATDEARDNCSPKQQECVPCIIVSSQASQAIPDQKSVCEENRANANRDQKSPGEKSDAQNKPYIQNPIVSHYKDAGHTHFLVRLSLEEVRLQMPET